MIWHSTDKAGLLALLPQNPNAVVSIQPLDPPSWFTPIGAWKKGKVLEAKMPDIQDCRFITLTLAQSRYYSASEGYEIGKRHLREFLYRLDLALGNTTRTPYMWKLEFHKSGWPHWHLILLHKTKIDGALLNRLWGKGRVQIQRIRGFAQKYLFKYACKPADLPQYIADLPRVRIVQASKNFYTASPGQSVQASPRPVKKTEKQDGTYFTELLYPSNPSSVGERLERDRGSFLIAYGEDRIVLHRAGLTYGEIVTPHLLHLLECGGIQHENQPHLTTNRLHIERHLLWQTLKQAA